MYAGFWKRVAAYILDQVIFTFAFYIIMFALGVGAAVSAGAGQPKETADVTTALLSVALSLGLYLFYFVYLESSSWQATPGKKACGIKVTDLNGNRISFWRSLGRNLGMWLSGLILCIGYMMCGWTRRKQCLHDMLAQCLVVDDNYVPTPDAPLPKQSGCLILLILIPVLLFGLGIVAALAMPTFFRSAERARAAEANVLLRTAAEAQQLHFDAAKKYARAWTALSVKPSGAVQSATYCTRGPQSEQTVQGFTGCGGANGFAVTLGPSSATAYRVNNNTFKYTIRLNYNGGAPVCRAQTPAAEPLCEKLNARNP